ncbi:PLP-dependent aminotransferase family protein [Belnapia sp. T6]|uniref:PLP-dependent aminotransferase family protein n=1 Tax=Belnapia mucosa TaxID=2804532 RepID=A0ABS1UXR2_9PROT|nr:PLP-dependent aminotransferase family protein [Belnapia mucosa]MBL6454107.1 PLP-dependent aminotransferase family protein [Belnapia mucosa]
MSATLPASLATLRLDRSQPVVEQIVEQIGAMIRGGSLAAGLRLPSVRALAGRLGCSVHSVVEAYDRLGALGLVAPRPGAGTFVATLGPAPAGSGGDPDLGDEAVSLRNSGPPALWKPGNGYLPEAWLRDAWPAAVLARVQRRMPELLACDGTARGDPALREQIALRLASQSMPVSPDCILLTHGGTQALDLIIRTQIQPGDCVLAEDPGYFKFYTMLERHGIGLHPIPMHPEGPDLDAVEAACRQHRPKLFLVQSVLHNPTGWTASPATLHRLLLIAERHGLLLVEDDTYADLHPGHPVRLLHLAGGQRLIYLSSFTKIVGPATRIGFIAAERPVIEALHGAKLLTSPALPPLVEALLAELLASGQYRRWLDRLRPKLAAARAGAVTRLQSLGFGLAAEGEPGLFLWAGLPPGCEPEALHRAALDHGLLLARGDLFRPDRGASRHFRFNAARSSDPRLFETLGAALKMAAAHP